jgi:hypothetical protein
MPRRRLRRDEHVVRQCSNSKLIKEQGVVVGVFEEAFRLRPGEEYLSATWLEMFDGPQESQLKSVVVALRGMPRDVKKKDGLIVLKVGTAEAHRVQGKKIVKCWHEPKVNNTAYAAVRGTRLGNDDLLGSITDCITNIVVVGELEPDR